jgi:hypothetical protein
MRKLAKYLEPQTPAHSLSSLLQCYADNVLSFDSPANRIPISAHAFDPQPTNEMAVAHEDKPAKLEVVTTSFLNSTGGDGFHVASMLTLISPIFYLSSAMCC